MTADRSIATIRRKTQRAREHLRNLQTEVTAFLATKPYKVGVKRDPDTRKPIYFVADVATTPAALPLIAGDVLQNLRSALDHLAWPVIETYIDDGVSGQESAKLVNRARMLADAVAGKFQVVIVRDFDRISRDDREGPSFVYMLQDAGVTVFEYVTRSPIKVDRAMDRTMLNMKAGFAAHEAEAASARTREQKHAKAQRGAIADGRVLGYKNIAPGGSRASDGTRRSGGSSRHLVEPAQRDEHDGTKRPERVAQPGV